MLPATRRWAISASLLVTGALGAGVLLTNGTTGATSAASTVSTSAAAAATTASTSTAVAPTFSYRVVRRSWKVLSTSVHRSTTSRSHIATVSVSVTSVATVGATTATGHATRSWTATRAASHSVLVTTSKAAALRRAESAALRGARRLADHAAARFARTRALAAAGRSSTSATTTRAVTRSSTNSSSMPVGNLPGWRQIFADDFNAPVNRGSFLAANSAKWGAYPSPWKDTSGHGVYSPEKTLSVSGGMLDIYLHTENGVHYVSAPEPKLPKMTYGRFSVRFQSDSVAGYKAAWLLWPNDDVWPAHGEIDFPEGDLDSNMSAFAHYASSGGGQNAFTQTARFSSWHTATIDWTPGKLVFYLDGHVVGTSTKMVPSTPMHWVLQTETALSGGAPSSSASGHVHIDWVTAYAYAP